MKETKESNMLPEIKIAKNIVAELTRLTTGNPVFENGNGSLYVSERAPVACIRLKISQEEYLQILNGLYGSEFTTADRVIPVDNASFDIVINGNVVAKDGVITIDGKKTAIL